MGMWSRLRLIIRSETNSALDGLENPKKGLDYGLERLEDNLRQARQSLVDVVSAQRLLQVRSEQAARAAAHHEQQARQALATGREDLAALALQRKQSVMAREGELEAAAANLAGQAESLKVALLTLQTRIELLRSKKEELKAIYDSSRAQLKVRETLAGLSADADDIGRSIRRAEEHIGRMQARASAIDGLASTTFTLDVLDVSGDDIDRELARAQSLGYVEDELARLKAEPAVGYLGDGRPGERQPGQGSGM